MTATLVTIALGVPLIAVLWWVGRLIFTGLLALGEALDKRWRQ